MLPEPFTITLAVFATIGFLNLVRQGYEASHKDIKAYKAAADVARRILEDVELVKWRIQLWKRIWSIGIDTHENFPEYLWGDGWSHIRSQIDKIERVARDVEHIILPFLPGHENALDPGNIPSASSHSNTLEAAEVQRLAQRELAIKQIDSELWWGKKVSFVMSKSAALEQLLEKFPVLFDQLDNICRLAYFDLHDQSKDISDSERRETATMKMLVSQAMRTREASWASHKSCCSMENYWIELELSLLRWKLGMDTPRPFSAGIPERLCYYLVIPSAIIGSIVHDPSDTPKGAYKLQYPLPPDLEVLVEKKSKPLGECKQTFKEVLTALCQDQSCYVRSLLEKHGNDADSVTFRFSHSADPVKTSDREDSSLPELLTKPATKSSDRDLSFRQRIEVAYRIAECCLLLLGTSWLSNLESQNITRAHSAGREDRYRLVVGPRPMKIDSYYEPQIYLQIGQVGQILRELALGSNIGMHNGSMDLNLISAEFGSQYQRAVEFCYEQFSPISTSTLENPDQAILTGFFQEVVLPLAKLHQANIPIQDQERSVDRFQSNRVLYFSPKTYGDAPVQPFGGLIPTLSTSRERPVTFLSTLRTTLKALSVRSTSTLGNFGKSDAIVYYILTQKFVKLAKNDVPSDAYRLEIPDRGMTHDIYLPTGDPTEKNLLATIRFEQLGLATVIRRWRGKIKELYIVDDLLGGLEAWETYE